MLCSVEVGGREAPQAYRSPAVSRDNRTTGEEKSSSQRYKTYTETQGYRTVWRMLEISNTSIQNVARKETVEVDVGMEAGMDHGGYLRAWNFSCRMCWWIRVVVLEARRGGRREREGEGGELITGCAVVRV